MSSRPATMPLAAVASAPSALDSLVAAMDEVHKADNGAAALLPAPAMPASASAQATGGVFPVQVVPNSGAAGTVLMVTGLHDQLVQPGLTVRLAMGERMMRTNTLMVGPPAHPPGSVMLVGYVPPLLALGPWPPASRMLPVYLLYLEPGTEAVVRYSQIGTFLHTGMRSRSQVSSWGSVQYLTAADWHHLVRCVDTDPVVPVTMPPMISRMQDAYQPMLPPMNLGVRAVGARLLRTCEQVLTSVPQVAAFGGPSPPHSVGRLAKQRDDVAADGAHAPGAGGPAGCGGRGRLRAVPGGGHAGAIPQLRHRHSGGTAAAGRRRGRGRAARGPRRHPVPAHLQRHAAGRPNALALRWLAVFYAHVPSRANPQCASRARQLSMQAAYADAVRRTFMHWQPHPPNRSPILEEAVSDSTDDSGSLSPTSARSGSATSPLSPTLSVSVRFRHDPVHAVERWCATFSRVGSPRCPAGLTRQRRPVFFESPHDQVRGGHPGRPAARVVLARSGDAGRAVVGWQRGHGRAAQRGHLVHLLVRASKRAAKPAAPPWCVLTRVLSHLLTVRVRRTGSASAPLCSPASTACAWCSSSWAGR